MTYDGNGTQRSIGKIEGQLTQLMQTIKADTERAEKSRSKVYEKLEKIESDVGSIDGRTSKLENTVESIEPLAKEFGRVRERSKGVFAVIVVAWTLLGGFLMWMGNNMLEWLIARLAGP